ncbi:MAG TPA: MFS transporter [Dermatophilaceae bacterium]|nr:MFS transporter [Dermatophilaceae bacterium]
MTIPPAVPPAPLGPMSPPYRLVTVTIVALVSIVAFEELAVGTAMPVVARELDAVRSYGLAFSSMLTAQLVAIVVAGLWTSRAGPLPALFLGQVLLAAGSAAAGLATSFAVLVGGRVVAGLGGGLLVIALYVVIGRAYPVASRPKVFGWTSGAWVLPSLVGPPLAGWLATAVSWRWVFLVVVPPVGLAAALGWSRQAQLLGDATVPPAARGGQRGAILWCLLVAVGAGALQWGTDQAGTLGGGATVVGAAAVLLGFPRLVPIGTLRMARGLPSVVLARFLLSATFNGSWVYLPLMLVGSRGLSPTVAGAMATVGSIGWFGGSYLQAREAFTPRPTELVRLGGLCVATSLVVLGLAARLDWPLAAVALGAAVGGIGMGFGIATTSVLALALAPVQDHGRTSAGLQLADVLGALLGIGAAGGVFAARHDGVRSDLPTFTLIWLVLAAVALLVLPAGQRSKT